jgi:regulator of sigma E protease
LIQSPGILITVLAFVLVLGPLVFVHELGHYLVGRWFGVKADEFSIGFGREIAGFTDKRGTRWKFGWLPLGGYVRFAGDMNPASQPDPNWLALPPEERAKTFQAKPLWQRALIVAAGPVTNFIAAIVIIAAFAMVYGVDKRLPVVGTVQAGSAAQSAGLKPGDKITGLGGRTIGTFDDLFDYVVLRPGQAVSIDFERGGQTLHADATIGTLTEKDKFGNVNTRGLLGVGPPPSAIEPVSIFEAPVVGVVRTAKILRMQIEGLGQILTGHRSIKDMGGPLKIAQVSGQSLAMGPEYLISLIAMISINLGFINLLPVPVLDGGHLFLYGIEAIRRRPVEPHVVEWAFRGGLMALLALMLLVTFNDLGAFGVWKNLAGLIG